MNKKPISTLTIADLHAIPIWRYWTEPSLAGDPDESKITLNGSKLTEFVAETSLSTIPSNSHDVFIAATSFEFPSGENGFGFSSPSDDSGLDYIQPVIIVPAGMIRFWHDSPISRDAMMADLSLLASDPIALFPIQFRCLIPVEGHIVFGTIKLEDCFPQLISEF